MKSRIEAMMAERQQINRELLNSYLAGFAPKEVEETWGGIARTVGNTLAYTVADGAGIKLKRPLFRALKTVNKKKKAAASKVPNPKSKPKVHATSSSTSPLVVDRKVFAAKLKAAGNQLSKIKSLQLNRSNDNNYHKKR
jgi:hypothetical protein